MSRLEINSFSRIMSPMYLAKAKFGTGKTTSWGFFYCCTVHVATRVVQKVKNLLPYKDIFDNRKETEYPGFITHLHLLLHIVTLDIEALVVPWHQFAYSFLVPDGRLAIQPVLAAWCIPLGHIWPSSLQSGPGTIGLLPLFDDEGAPCW